MTRADEDRAALARATDATRRVRRRLVDSIEETQGLRMTPETVEARNRDLEKTVDALLKRYEQLFDHASRQLLRLGLLAMAEPLAGMSARDAFDRAEALGAATAAARWMEFAAIRNRLAHDYSLDPGKRADGINEALATAPGLVAAVDDLLDLWRRRGLLEGETP